MFGNTVRILDQNSDLIICLSSVNDFDFNPPRIHSFVNCHEWPPHSQQPHLGHTRRALIQSRYRAIVVAVIIVTAILMVDINIALGRVIGHDRADIQRRKQALRPIRHLTESDGNASQQEGTH